MHDPGYRWRHRGILGRCLPFPIAPASQPAPLKIAIVQSAPDTLAVTGDVSCTIKARPPIATTGTCSNVYFVQIGARLAVMAGSWKYDVSPQGRETRLLDATSLYYVRGDEHVDLAGDCMHLDLADEHATSPLEDPADPPTSPSVTAKVQLPSIARRLGAWTLGCKGVPSPAIFSPGLIP